MREIIENSNAFDDLESECNIRIIEIVWWSDVESDENNLGTSAHYDCSCKMGKQSDVDNSDAYHFSMDHFVVIW